MLSCVTPIAFLIIGGKWTDIYYNDVKLDKKSPSQRGGAALNGLGNRISLHILFFPASHYGDESQNEENFVLSLYCNCTVWFHWSYWPLQFFQHPKLKHNEHIQDLLFCCCFHYVWTQPFTPPQKSTLFVKVLLVWGSCHCITWLFFLYPIGLSQIQSWLAIICLGLGDIYLSYSICDLSAPIDNSNLWSTNWSAYICLIWWCKL